MHTFEFNFAVDHEDATGSITIYIKKENNSDEKYDEALKEAVDLYLNKWLTLG